MGSGRGGGGGAEGCRTPKTRRFGRVLGVREDGVGMGMWLVFAS